MLCLCTERGQRHYGIASISSIADSITGRNPFLPSGGQWHNIKISVKPANVTGLQPAICGPRPVVYRQNSGRNNVIFRPSKWHHRRLYERKEGQMIGFSACATSAAPSVKQRTLLCDDNVAVQASKLTNWNVRIKSANWHKTSLIGPGAAIVAVFRFAVSFLRQRHNCAEWSNEPFRATYIPAWNKWDSAWFAAPIGSFFFCAVGGVDQSTGKKQTFCLWNSWRKVSTFITLWQHLWRNWCDVCCGLHY